MELCKPANLILLISIGGTLYHLLFLDIHTAMWWVAVGILGVATFQGLCYSGVETLAWLIMLIPVLLLCFFLAVALLASSMRIRNFKEESACTRTRCNHEHNECVREYRGERNPLCPSWYTMCPVKVPNEKSVILDPFTMVSNRSDL
jgi:hypothetical protein